MKKRLFLFASCLLSLCSCGESGSISSESSLDSQEEPITNKYLLDKKAKEFQMLADRCEYDFDPTSVVMTKRKNVDGSDLTANDIKELTKTIKSVDDVRMKDGKEIHICYSFEGLYAEGYSGDYAITNGRAVLWEDGLSFYQNGSSTSGGTWWNDSGKVHINYIKNGDVLETETREVDGECVLDIPVLSYWGNIKVSAKGGYYYPTIGIFIEDIGLRKEVEADEIYFKKTMASECPVYTIDKSLHYSKIDPFDYRLEFIHTPEWNYPHDDEYIATYKGMTATYNVSILPSKRNFSYSDMGLENKTFPLYSFDYLKDIEVSILDEIAFNFSISGSELHTYLNEKTGELSVYLPNGKIKKTIVNLNTREEDNHFITATNEYEFGFTFKSRESLEISVGDKKETVKIALSHEFGNCYSNATIIEEEHNHEDCLIDKLPLTITLMNSLNKTAVTINRANY